MGLFDGAVDGRPSSTADVARLLDAPVLLVIDASAMSTSVAAVVRGHTGHPAAAVAITFEQGQAAEGEVEHLTAAVLRTASALERRVNPRA
jgi:cobyrinic acid a,c-diamide synthase